MGDIENAGHPESAVLAPNGHGWPGKLGAVDISPLSGHAVLARPPDRVSRPRPEVSLLPWLGLQMEELPKGSRVESEKETSGPEG